MPTSGPVITAFSAETLDPPSTADRMLRVLRAAKMAPIGVPGRGTAIGNFTPFHYVCLILGYAGAKPSDAAEAAAALLPLVWRSSIKPDGLHPYGALPYARSPRVPGTLGEALATIISDQSGQRYTPDLLLTLSPPGAEVTWVGDDGLPELVERYGPPGGSKVEFKNWGIRRLTLVKSSLIWCAVSLWRGIPEDESAETPGRASAPDCRTAQGHTTGPHPEPTPDGPSASTQET